MRHIPPLAAVRVFEAAARHGNFTRAGEELGMTQAAVSYQIKLIEERLGAALFARAGRGIVLTEMGRRIAPQVTSAFDLLGEAFATARAEDEAVLTISAPHTFAANWLAGRLGGFQLARSPLAVRVRVSDELADFAQGDVDVAIRGSDDPWPGLTSHFLMRLPIAPFATPALCAEHAKLENADDILSLPLVSRGDVWWQRWFATLTGTPLEDCQRGGVRFDSQILDGTAALAGHGAAMLNPLMWQQAIVAGQLVQLHPHFTYEANIFRLVYPERKRNLAKVRAFKDWILAEVAAALGDDPYRAGVPPEGER